MINSTPFLDINLKNYCHDKQKAIMQIKKSISMTISISSSVSKKPNVLLMDTPRYRLAVSTIGEAKRKSKLIRLTHKAANATKCAPCVDLQNPISIIALKVNKLNKLIVVLRFDAVEIVLILICFSIASC